MVQTMNINVDLFYLINHNLQNPVFDAILPYVTHLGGFIWLVIILVAVIIYAKIKSKNNLKRLAMIALISLLFADLIAYAVKLIVQEPRPYTTLDNVRLLIYEDDLFAFPSGHATSTLAVVTSLLLNIKEKKAFKILLVIFAVTILFSRVYCGIHYPFDVLAGAILGILGAITVNHFLKEKIFNR